ncbi:Sjogren's syndrome/scleroderma autoantigen 1 (Autoantigen p27) protein [Besnoitia besnoiti]|uniref:Sjogren's syndrome/scleroderma autoantigen 1 (Autoantigen p27) protein n=1 Tax=Besnoitia besnoiti TaxID=94643 RepID=A0A2A9MJU1_BESBE|nr:Sjogren's syndrome/scleroderma autoantigen 1 (Autoantigen p27) protein [Besnoitia besnoiti]PFH35867.1 Sjogren's syndrome/scleroderma autoantigen 1 (Autoantigen p27) protein [Besnoitia besnoiti]
MNGHSGVAACGGASAAARATEGKRGLSGTDEKKKSASEGLAEKLLLGWTMLGDTCPQCVSVPLMRDKQHQLFCVACEAFVPPSLLEDGGRSAGARRPQAEDTKREQRERVGPPHGEESRYDAAGPASIAGRGPQYQMVASIPLNQADNARIQSTLSAAVGGEGLRASHGDVSDGGGRGVARVSSKSLQEDDEYRTNMHPETAESGSYLQVSAELLKWREETLRRCGLLSGATGRPAETCAKPYPAAPVGNEAACQTASAAGASRRPLPEELRLCEKASACRGEALSEARTAVLGTIRRYAVALTPHASRAATTLESERQVLLSLQTALQVLGTLDSLA